VIARLALDKGHDLAAGASTQQVTFPVPRYRAVLRRRGPFTYWQTVSQILPCRLFSVCDDANDAWPGTSAGVQGALSSVHRGPVCRGFDRRSRVTPDS
jgi:hypothetical protein